MMWQIPFTCTQCKQSFSAKSWKSIDVVVEPGLRKVIMSGSFNLNICTNCGHKAKIHGPFILWEDFFIAVVLAERYESNAAAFLIKQLLEETKPSRDNLPVEVIIFATWEKLQKSLFNPNLTGLRLPIRQLLISDTAQIKDPLDDLADALLQQDMPRQAFNVYYDIIRFLPELYLDHDAKEKLSFLAYAAANQIDPEQSDSKTSIELLNELASIMAPLDSTIPSFGFYEVFYCPIDEQGASGEGLQFGDSHAINLINCYIRSEPIPKDIFVKATLLIWAFSSKVQGWLSTHNPSIERWKILTKMTFDFEWYRLSRESRTEIARWFFETTGSNINEEY